MVLNSVDLREYILEVIVVICSLASRCYCMLKLESILEIGPKVNDFIKDPFK
jgi:NRPS condensation-like uncharacterized protein